MKVEILITMLQSLPANTDIFVNAWSPEADYDHTDHIKICTLSGIKVSKAIICDENSTYWSRKIKPNEI